jgi:hypothetical protein
VWGIVLLAGAHRFVGRGRAAVVAARLLGSRYLAQGAVLIATPRAPVRTVRIVDALHAASMLAFMGSARYRRPALVSATIAVGLVVLAGKGRPHATFSTLRR